MQGVLKHGLLFSLMVFFLGLVVLAPPALADEAAVKYRQTVMKSLGAHMGAMAAIVKGQVSVPGHAAEHGESIAAIGRMAKDLFPAGSDVGNTGALPAVWEQPEEFAKVVAEFETASANLVTAANGSDSAALGAAFGAVGKTCGACHRNFREKK